MSPKQPTSGESSRRPWMRARDMSGLMVLTSSCLLLTMCYWWYHGGHRGKLLEIDRADPREAKFLVDINEADWPEIIQLPGLGEILAQRVVSDREQNGPFGDVEELTRVNGIGPRTLERIRPYLLPIPQDTDWAASDIGDELPLQ